MSGFQSNFVNGNPTGTTTNSSNTNITTQYGSASTDETPMALLEQLVYVDNFLQSSDPSNEQNFDEQLSAELAAFADDTFIFPDEEKPKMKRSASSMDLSNSLMLPGPSSNQNVISFNHVSPAAVTNGSNSRAIPSTIQELLQQGQASSITSPVNGLRDVHNQQIHLSGLQPQQQQQQQQQTSSLPRVTVPQGAQSTLSAAGLSQTQIEALATLIAYHKPDILNQDDSAKPSRTQASNSADSPIFTSIARPSQRTSNSGRSSMNALSSAVAQVSSFEPINHFSPQQPTETPPSSTTATNSSVTTTSMSPAQQLAATVASLTNTQSSATATPSSVSNLMHLGNADSRSSLTASILNGSSANSSFQRTVLNSPAPETPHFSKSDNEYGQNGEVVDKRRRNTAASARFRIKKKIKEQEMERTLKDLADLSKSLELKIQQLEMENRLLRNLVVEKGNQRDTEELERLRQRAKISVDQMDGGGDGHGEST